MTVKSNSEDKHDAVKEHIDYRILSPAYIRDEMRRISVDPGGVDIMAEKADTICIKIGPMSSARANILKQNLLVVGGDAAITRDAISGKTNSHVIVISSRRSLKKLFSRLRSEELMNDIREKLEESLKIGTIEQHYIGKFVNGYSIMGILNVTPDSFYDGGKYFTPENAIAHAKNMVLQGAEIIDVGGESTRPGAKKVFVDEERKRVIPVLKQLIDRGINVSVDTYKSEIAEEALDMGAKVINDISGLRFDKRTARVIARHDAGSMIMHIKGTPDNMQRNPVYNDLISEIYEIGRAHV